MRFSGHFIDGGRIDWLGFQNIFIQFGLNSNMFGIGSFKTATTTLDLCQDTRVALG